MSWWDDGAEVLGDLPADKLTAAWRRVLLPRRDAGAGLPALPEVLAAFAASLRTADVAPPFEQLVLHRDPGPSLAFKGDEDAPGDLRAAFDQAVAAVARDYRSAFDRAPTPMELAKALEFVVRPAPEEYFSDPAETLDRGSWWLRAEPVVATAQ